jgi:hypothetical protein
MVIDVVNHYQLRAQVSLTILPVPQPHNILYHSFASLMIPKLFCWSFFTIKFQLQMLATNVDFFTQLART